MSNKTQVKCPQCGLLTFYSPENKARPFCSERCKLIDLGQWASEGYKIPVKSTSDYTSDLNPNEFDLNSESEDRADEDQ